MKVVPGRWNTDGARVLGDGREPRRWRADGLEVSGGAQEESAARKRFHSWGSSSPMRGVRLLTKSVALHCARQGYGIRCNSVHPTFIDTPRVDELARLSGNAEAAKAYMAKQIPLGQLGEPDDVAYAIVYLASDESKLMTGSELVIDGGTTAQ